MVRQEIPPLLRVRDPVLQRSLEAAKFFDAPHQVSHRLGELVIHEGVEIALVLLPVEPLTFRRDVIVARLLHELRKQKHVCQRDLNDRGRVNRAAVIGDCLSLISQAWRVAVRRDAEHRVGYLPAEIDFAAGRLCCRTRTPQGRRRRTDHIASVDEFPASTATATIETDVRAASLAEPRGQTTDSCGQ